MRYLKIYGITLGLLVTLDLLWVGVMAKGLYAKLLGDFIKSTPDWVAAAIFYVVYTAGIVYFVLVPALEKQSGQCALLTGMFFGFIGYAVYALTNLATLKNWPPMITYIDLVWGTTVGGLVSLIAYLFANRIRG